MLFYKDKISNIAIQFFDYYSINNFLMNISYKVVKILTIQNTDNGHSWEENKRALLVLNSFMI